MSSSIQNIGRIPELQRRILFTLGMLAVYRVGAKIATPGIDADVIRQTFQGLEGSVFTLFNIFSGGALEQLSIFALGIMPYISASIIMQLLTVVIPSLEALKREGERGQRQISQYTRYFTIVLAAFQSMLLAYALENGQFGAGAVLDPGWSFRLTTAITLTAGTAFIMWLGEQITERGIGNGISLVIFSGILVTIPGALGQLYERVRSDQFTLLEVIFLFAFIVALTGFVVFVERGQRRIPIQHARRVVGRKVTQGGMSYFPLRVNTANVIPPIFASSLLIFPTTVAQFTDASGTVNRIFQDYLFPGGLLYNGIYVGMIVFFAFFYTAILINPDDVADNIRRSGGSIPGVRPGKSTAAFIDTVLSRITLVGAVYVSAICLVPVYLSDSFGVPFYFGGTALLIVVGVGMDLMAQVEAHLLSRQYEGFVQGARMRGRLGR
ncbi:MAG: preprotein translocase subunit SecY [Deltaproteobacteria bacterium]|nr:preprotein translocase subunit SecY [Deltaproteobacteria bacterium]MDD9828691.1 preprotein translocase subunit SecY [Deltaproteobacteria bacterium]MDD9854501.1 preprotein translocase subunit SecY [Deltaproteobacteria bacterium]MDD9873466.1 preprotein translocase subunit SecY [Deltaproteobacteria bacterium]